MKAVSYESKEKMAVSSRAKPALKAPTDALIISGKAKPGKKSGATILLSTMCPTPIRNLINGSRVTQKS